MTACHAAEAALYFEPDGRVHACCATRHTMGRVYGPARASLRSIWEGARADELRSALDRDDFSLGCQECGEAAARVGRHANLARWFDRFSEGPYAFPRMMDFALSSRCNLACVMCNGTLSSTIRKQREELPALPDAYDERFFAELREFLPHLERAQFKGGEPFLAPENRRVWDDMLEVGVPAEVAVTTNATVLTAEAEHYLVDLAMHPIVSVDGVTSGTLEAIRVGVDADHLWRNIDRIQSLAETVGNGMTMTYCLLVDNWHEMGAFLSEVERRGLQPNVVRVEAPAEHSLKGLAQPILKTVHESLVREGDRRILRSDEAQRVWQEVLDWVGSLAATGTESGEGWVPVALGGPIGARAVEDLRAWAGGRLLELTTSAETIDAVAGPPMLLRRLQAEDWTGRRVSHIPGLVGAALGTHMLVDMTVDEEDVIHAFLSSDAAADGSPRVRGVSVPTGGPDRRTIHIGLR